MTFKQCTISLISIWLLIFALLPFLLVFIISFLTPNTEHFIDWHFTLQNYANFFSPIYLTVFWRSFYFACFTAFICLIIAYPFAYIIAKTPVRIRPFFMLLVIIPFWTSALIRTYSLIIIIRDQGLLNHLLLWLGIIHHPLHILYSQIAVMIGLIYSLLPFMILPIYANLEKFNWHLIDAARDLGATRIKTLIKIVIPITLPGITAGIMLVLFPAMTLFYIPDILGGAKSLLLGNVIKNEFIEAYNWPMGAAVSVALTLLMSTMLIAYWKMTTEKSRQEAL